jgi:lipopolysaccharide transport system permease protein
MTTDVQEGLHLTASPPSQVSADHRARQAARDIADGLRRWRLAATLGWLDIRLRYRGSLLGPFWLTLSTAVMVGALGVLYSALFKTDLHTYLPFLALSMVLWNLVSALVTDACVCFTQSEGIIRSVRLPYTLHALRVVARNVLILAHTLIVIVIVFAYLDTWPGWTALLALPSFALWLIDAAAVCLLLGSFCARFRDIPPIVASVMQIAFFMSPIIWKPELVHDPVRSLLPLNPFFSLFEIVRAPLLGEVPGASVWLSALLYTLLICAVAWGLFLRARPRIAFWV